MVTFETILFMFFKNCVETVYCFFGGGQEVGGKPKYNIKVSRKSALTHRM